uniref:DUF1619 domain-containing protein n=1 Tax=Macrostomum lignano TaxID=282301 RepID=A0A1I8J1R3_9PLAT
TIGHQISGLLVNRLGVSPKFLRQLQCSRNSLAPIESCPYFDKPQLPSQADCQLHHLCMGLVCCLDLDLGFVSRSFSAWAFVDPCQHIRVEHIGDSLLVKYKLDHKPDDSALFLDAAFDLCLDGNCLATPITLLNEARLPVPLCSGSGNLSWPEFNSSDIRDHMVDKAREMLMQRLGLEKDFLKQGDCALPPGSSSLANPHCPNFRLTRDLPDSVQCQLSDDCLELRCCVKLKLITLEKSFSASLRLDPCAMTFSAQFENWAITRPVFTDFSKWLKILIGKALSIDIQFNRHHDGQLELAWHVANCAGHASCNDEVLPLLSDARPPGVLMNRLELDRQLLKQPQCRPELYAKKWPPHCTFADVTLRLNREPYNCKIHDQCLGIECCTELDFKVYSRHFFYTQLVDPCTYSFYIGFENFFYNQSLFHFDWGQDKLLKIAGSTVELRYNLTRTPDLLNLIVTARLAICKEGYCELANTNFLNHYLMPIPRCYSNGSLSWTVERDQVSHTIKGISGLVLTRLNLERGVISDDSCRLGDVEIQRSFSACPHTIIPSLPAGMRCKLTSQCTGIDCCMDINLGVASRSFKFWISVDPCKFIYTFGFERWVVTQSLIGNFGLFGTPYVHQLGNVNIRTKLDRSADFQNFIFTFGVTICQDGGCSSERIFLENTALPIPGCNSGGGLSWPSIGERSVSGLLVNRLGIASKYLRPSQCNLASPPPDKCPHMPPIHGLENLRCAHSDGCMGVDCCAKLDLGIVSRSFLVRAFVDPCVMVLSISFDNWLLNRTLLSFVWGVEQREQIAKTVRLIYNLDKSADDKEFVLTARIELCLDDAGQPCTVVGLLDNQRLQVPLCHTNGTIDCK